ncbi:hypothetical protein ACWDXV_21765 [Nocardia nova]|uniref:hypothetical protein n=1 Tax=Nocardia nova TaxID=37330 RepID=UPI000CEA59D8|nr:hypothetical protein [Nocardia nova]PPJ12106.1 hypothetical protein C5E51_07290 [Nocardia nova]PPJ14834.1 hypothetical protein C5E44_21035 [Nocardia nova]
MSKTQPSAEPGRALAPPKELTDSGALIIGATAGIGLATADVKPELFSKIATADIATIHHQRQRRHFRSLSSR